MLLILAALREEISGLLRSGNVSEIDTPSGFLAWSGAFDRSSGGSRFAVVVSGTGHERARNAAEWAVENVESDHVLVTGFAGSALAALQGGDLVLATKVSCTEGSPVDWSAGSLGAAVTPDRGLTARARSVAELSGIDLTLGLVMSLPVVARTAGLKAWIGSRLGAAAVDLESYAASSVAMEAGARFTVVRAIVDVLSCDLPELVSKVGQGPSDGKVYRALTYLARRPSELSSLRRLAGSSSAARRTLTKFCIEFSRRLNEADGVGR